MAIRSNPACYYLGSRDSPQSWNRYAYVNGSPLSSVDPSGMNTIGLGSFTPCGFIEDPLDPSLGCFLGSACDFVAALGGQCPPVGSGDRGPH